MTDALDSGVPAIPRDHQVELTIREVLDASPEESMVLVVRRLEGLAPDQKGSDLELFLQSMWNHLEGLQALTRDNNPVRAKELQELAMDGFKRLGVDIFEAVSRSLCLFVGAVIDLRVYNFRSALDHMAEAEAGLIKAGQYGRKFQVLLDHMKPEQLAVGAIPALMQGDDASARVLLKQASESYTSLADRYYEKGSPEHSMTAGFGYFYIALYDYFRAVLDLNSLDLDKFASQKTPENAMKAEQLLSKANLDIAQARHGYEISRCLVEATKVNQGVAVRMKLCFEAAFKPDLQGFRDLRATMSRAIDYASNVGPQGLPIVTMLRRDEERLKNLEKLARPRKSDFGIFSGLISAVLFAILLLTYGWTRSTFGAGLETRELMVIVGLALIGGFGFGALRFWSYFSGFLSHSQDNKADAG